jgi:putative ABC transport system substrate-binding protein
MKTGRVFIIALALGMVTAPVSADAQPSAAQLPRIGILMQTASPPPPTPQVQWLLQGLRELGYEDGRNVVFEIRYGANDARRLAELAAELVHLNVAVIATVGDLATRSAQQATRTIPIVASVGDPVESGFTASLARPGGNVTGVATLAGELAPKRLELLKEVVPKLRRVAVLRDPVTSERQLKAAEAGARALKLEAQIVEARAPSDFERAFEAVVRGRADALLMLVSPMFLRSHDALIGLAAKNRIPAMYTYGVFAERGGLMAYSPAHLYVYRSAAGLIDKILKGAKPAELPWQQATKLELVVNLKTAKALGLTIPQSVLVRADHVIQ